MSDQMVRLVNKSDTDFKDMYNSTTYRVPAGSEGFAPFDAACLWLGDPSSQDLSQRERGRTDEYERLRVRYGVYGEEARFAGAVPNIEVYTLDGDRITMVREDPAGEQVSPGNPFKPTTDADPLAARMNAMQDQLNRLLTGISSLPADQQAKVAEAARATTAADHVDGRRADERDSTERDAHDSRSTEAKSEPGEHVVARPKPMRSADVKAGKQTTIHSDSPRSDSPVRSEPPVDAPTRPQVK